MELENDARAHFNEYVNLRRKYLEDEINLLEKVLKTCESPLEQILLVKIVKSVMILEMAISIGRNEYGLHFTLSDQGRIAFTLEVIPITYEHTALIASRR